MKAIQHSLESQVASEGLRETSLIGRPSQGGIRVRNSVGKWEREERVGEKERERGKESLYMEIHVHIPHYIDVAIYMYM